MWPLEARPSDLVRVGRDAVEHWRRTSSGWSLGDRQAIARDAASSGASPFLAPIQALFSTTRPATPIDVVLESCWLPAMLVTTGRQLTAPADVEALLRHRLASLYGDGPDPVEGWALRCVHRAGEAQALGYGLPPQVVQGLQQSAGALGLQWRSMRPALDWGLEQLVRRRSVSAHWALWPEQDRALLACFEGRRMVALNAAVALPRDAAELAALVRRESVRQGLSAEAAPVAVAHWDTGGALLRWTWQALGERRSQNATSAPSATGQQVPA